MYAHCVTRWVVSYVTWHIHAHYICTLGYTVYIYIYIVSHKDTYIWWVYSFTWRRSHMLGSRSRYIVSCRTCVLCICSLHIYNVACDTAYTVSYVTSYICTLHMHNTHMRQDAIYLYLLSNICKCLYLLPNYLYFFFSATTPSSKGTLSNESPNFINKSVTLL